VVVTPNVIIGRRVNIWQHATLAARGSQIIIEEGVMIGAHAIVIARRGAPLRIGREAVVGAGAIVTHDVPGGSAVVSAPSRVISERTAGMFPEHGQASGPAAEGT
jgi:serine acetyltransferase